MVFHTQRESKTFHECVLITLSYILPLKLDRGTLGKKKSIAGAHDFFVVVLLGAGASELFSEGPCVCMWLLAEHAVSARLANTDALVSHLALL